MYLELHLLQNFAPSNLNRDDTGSPKECVFGGVSRARISSQCLKRTIRHSAEFRRTVAGYQAVRTRRLIVEIAERLSGKRPAPENVTKTVADVFKEAGLERPEQRSATPKDKSATEPAVVAEEKDNTKLLLFMDARSIDQAVEVFRTRWEPLTRGDKDQRSATITDLGNILAASARVPDVALFGRMIEMDSKTPFGKLQLGMEAATQVAHAISTHQVTTDEDFYTAVDDLLSRDETGAGMMGTIPYNSACYYRYANVNLAQLAENLQGNHDLAGRTAEAFVRAAIRAVPTGKQTSMAAQNPPSFVMIVLRDNGLWSLANAFERPVWPSEDRGLIVPSIHALDRQWGKLAKMYGTNGIHGVWVTESEDAPLPHLSAFPRTHRVDSDDSVSELIKQVLAALRAGVVA